MVTNIINVYTRMLILPVVSGGETYKNMYLLLQKILSYHIIMTIHRYLYNVEEYVIPTYLYLIKDLVKI